MSEEKFCILCGRPVPKGRRNYCSRECMLGKSKKTSRKKERQKFRKPVAVEKKRSQRPKNEIDIVARKAREAGMTYGQYVGKMYAEGLRCRRSDR